jgi:hypothetical protein
VKLYQVKTNFAYSNFAKFPSFRSRFCVKFHEKMWARNFQRGQFQILEQSTRVGRFSYRPASAGVLKQSMGARNLVGIRLSYRPASAGILEQSMGARNRVGIRLSYRPARLHRLAKTIPCSQFLGFLRRFKNLAT